MGTRWEGGMGAGTEHTLKKEARRQLESSQGTLLEKYDPLCKTDLVVCSSGEGNGTPLQYSCLENPIDGGAWQATVHGVAKSQTQVK